MKNDVSILMDKLAGCEQPTIGEALLGLAPVLKELATIDAFAELHGVELNDVFETYLSINGLINTLLRPDFDEFMAAASRKDVLDAIRIGVKS